jgi:photosystem II stability/assembly factor-like uncharacterized protein
MIAEATARSSAMRARRRRRFGFTGAAVVVVVLALVSATVLVPARLDDRKAGPAQSRATTTHKVAPNWRFVADVSGGWRVVATPKVSTRFHLTCPSTNTCFALGWTYSGPQPIAQLAVSTDGGGSWSPVVLPTQISQDASIGCVDANTCFVVGLDLSGSPHFFATSDEGGTWSSRTGPRQLEANSYVVGLNCTSADHCVIVAANLTQDINTPFSGYGPPFSLVTTDGGSTWSQGSLPSNLGPSEISCVSSMTCVAVGFAGSWDESAGTIAYSSDGGLNWSTAAIPDGTPALRSVDCSDASDCMASASSGSPETTTLLRSTDGGRTWTAAAGSGLPQAMVTSISCPTSTNCWVSGALTPAGGGGPVTVSDSAGLLASSSDGGGTWQSAQLPTGVQAIVSVSCAETTSCYALAVMQPSPNQFTLGLLSDNAG